MKVHMQNNTIKTKEWNKYTKAQKKVIFEELKMMLLGGFLYRLVNDKVEISEEDEKSTGIHKIVASIETAELMEAIYQADLKHNSKKEEPENGNVESQV